MTSVNHDTRIRRVRTHVLEAQLAQPFAYSQAWYDRRGAMLVEIETESGIVGWGEAFGPARISAAVVQHLAPLLVGRDALAGDAHWEALYNALRDHGQKGGAIEGLSAIDIALWDIRGRHFGVPVSTLLGGPLRNEVRAYATGLYRRRRDDHATYLCEEALDYVERGFPAVKLKIGFGLDEDIALTRAVRAAIGPTVGLMVDANHAYDVATALAYGRACADLGLRWFEEPVAPEDRSGYAEVRRGISIPVAGGEAEFTRYGFRDLFVARAVDIAQPDVMAAGGITRMQAHLRHGDRVWHPLQSACVGYGHRTRRVVAAARGRPACSAVAPSDPADAGIRLQRASDPATHPHHAARARERHDHDSDRSRPRHRN